MKARGRHTYSPVLFKSHLFHFLSSGAEGGSRTHNLPVTKRRPASLNKRLSNLFNDLTARHCQSLPAIPHRLAKFSAKVFLRFPCAWVRMRRSFARRLSCSICLTGR